MIRTVVFDIGRVLVDFDWDGYIHGLIFDEEIIQRINQAVWGSGLWTEFDRGVMSDEEIIRKMTEYDPGLAKEIRLSVKDVSGTVVGRPTSLPWIRGLKEQGLQVLYLSNYSYRLRTQNPGALEFLKETDGGIFSYEVHLLKPDPAIYHALCEKYAVVPEEAVFLDDLKENVSGAVSVGMQGICYTDQEETERRLQALLEENNC